MEKDELIKYLNQVRPYLNLKSVCDLYNKIHSDEMIDYNNLRAVINQTAVTRLSTERLRSFVLFLFNDLYSGIFICNKSILIIDSDKINQIVEKGINKIKNDILEEIKNGI